MCAYFSASTIIPVANLIDIDGPPIDAATVLPQAQKQVVIIIEQFAATKCKIQFTNNISF